MIFILFCFHSLCLSSASFSFVISFCQEWKWKEKKNGRKIDRVQYEISSGGDLCVWCRILHQNIRSLSSFTNRPVLPFIYLYFTLNLHNFRLHFFAYLFPTVFFPPLPFIRSPALVLLNSVSRNDSFFLFPFVLLCFARQSNPKRNKYEPNVNILDMFHLIWCHSTTVAIF